ncbi:MAG: toll/interleukin-1 receptor domain-containing protein [Phycisphaerales bacterium]|nr:toll/interleukin-1 receptor domain-containing protein [Phycisphaerales bacterium]
MANPEHVEIVKKGSVAIAKWREHHQMARLDLRWADMRGAELSLANLNGASLYRAKLNEANLNRANLNHANLHCADLREANLPWADLRGADLRGADLRGADLRRANLSRANLNGAKLNGVTLLEANLTGADLRGADFDKALSIFTTFDDVDLSDAKNLETIVHHAPSTVGVDTLFKSKGRIPEAFLRGCGVPEVLIEYLPSLIGQMQPIQFYSCFISYSGKDDAFARRLHARLQAEKLRVWFAPEDMRGGRKSERQIDEAIRLHDRLLLVLSEYSMNSEWVIREIKKARKKEKETGKDVLFPIALVPYAKIQAWECLDHDTGEDLAQKIREFHIPTNFSKWKTEDEFEKAFAALMRDLRRQDDPKPNS